jgi:hypothetical protein
VGAEHRGAASTDAIAAQVKIFSDESAAMWGPRVALPPEPKKCDCSAAMQAPRGGAESGGAASTDTIGAQVLALQLRKSR